MRVVSPNRFVLATSSILLALCTALPAQVMKVTHLRGNVYDGNGGRGTIPDPPPTRNDDERRDWILNDEGLYNWARSEGVRI